MKDTIISFNDYSFQYQSQSEPTLHGINLEIGRGEKVIIVGASGCGKSTLAHCLNGLIPFSYPGEKKGSLTIFGQETSELSIFELSRYVGTVLQDTDGQFIGMTVLEDIAFALENDMEAQEQLKKQTYEAAVQVNLTDKLDAAPHELSGGQKQRVSLAGVLISAVPILLFDEPLANLDPMAGKEAISLIDRIQKETGTTVIIIEHRLEDALHMGADRIILMEDGRILQDCPPSVLFAGNSLTEAGIREPLYITALKYAGVVFRGGQNLGRIQDLTLDGEQKEKLHRWFEAQENAPGQKQTEHVLCAENLTFGYTDGRQNLRDISFIISRGEMVSIVGKNGAGKSTLAKLLCGFERQDNGIISYCGTDISDATIKERASFIGYVMQNPNQMISKPMILDEVSLALRIQNRFSEEEIQKKAEQSLKRCGLYEFRSWPVSALSYGQKKRVTIASILIQEPDILILDEPTAGQDFRHYTEFMDFLEQLNRQGITVLMITHDMHLMLEYTSRTLVFSDTMLIADTTPARLFSDEELIERASLKETSLFALAQMCGADPEAFIEKFIYYDRRVRK